MATITSVSGRQRTLPSHVNPEQVAGLDADGRVVVDTFGVLNDGHAASDMDFLFGLTLCCDAYDKGMEDGVFCRACYGGARNADAGSYLYRSGDTFPELDPIKEIRP